MPKTTTATTAGTAMTAVGAAAGASRGTTMGRKKTGNDSDSDGSEESALIVWEDRSSGVTDLRHLLHHDDDDDEDNDDDEGDVGDGPGGKRPIRGGGGRRGGRGRGGRAGGGRLPIAMTQQIEELSFDDDDASSSSSSSAANGDERDGAVGGNDRDGVGRKAQITSSFSANDGTTMTPPPPPVSSSSSSSSSCDLGRRGGGGEEAMNGSGGGGRDHGGVGGGRRRRRLPDDPGDVPATISKLRGRRRGLPGRGRRRGEGSMAGDDEVVDGDVVVRRRRPRGGAADDPMIAAIAAGDGGVALPPAPPSLLSPVDEDDDEDYDDRRGGEGRAKKRRLSGRREVDRHDGLSSRCVARSTSMPAHKRLRRRLSSSSSPQQSGGEGNDAARRDLFLRRSHTHPPQSYRERPSWHDEKRETFVIDGCVVGGGGDVEGRFNERNNGKLSSSSSGGRISMIDNVSGSGASNKMGAVERDGNGRSDLFREIELGLDRACAVDAVDTDKADRATATAGASDGRVKADPIVAIAAPAAIAEAEAVAASSTTESLTTKTAAALVVACSCGVVGAASRKRVESAMASGALATATPITRGIAMNNHSFAGVGANGCNSHRQGTIVAMVSDNVKAEPTAAITVAAAIVKTEAAAASSTTASWTTKTAAAAVISCCIGGAASRNSVESATASGALATVTPMTRGISMKSPSFADVGVNGGSSYRQGNIVDDHQNSNNNKEKGLRANCDDDYDNDEEWNEVDFAAIDLSVAAQQRQSQQQHPASAIDSGSAAPLLLDNIDGNNCDDESWNDDDLAAIDLSVAALTQQRSFHNHSTSIKSTKTTADTAPQNSSNIAGADATDGDFDDDDRLFAEVDFEALDDAIVQQQQQRQQLSTSQQQESPPLSSSHIPPPPPTLAPIRNRRRHHLVAPEVDGSHLLDEESPLPSYMSFTRYIVRTIQEDLATHIKTIGVSLWKENPNLDDKLDRLKKICTAEDNAASCISNEDDVNVIDGYMYLQGEWFYAPCHAGDVVHLCSLSGNYLTDVTALPVMLHSHHVDDGNDDLMLVLHPDELISPTIVSDAVQCPRLAVLKMRLGSTGLSSKSAVFGILRHELFQRCLTTRDASHKSAALYTRQIIRDNAEALIGCGIFDRSEAFGEVIKTLSQVQRFLSEYTSWKDVTKPPNQQKENQHPQQTMNECDSYASTAAAPRTVLKGTFASYDTLMEIRGVYSTEECAYVPELGLKGYVDATTIARTKSLNPPMMLELPSSSSLVDAAAFQESLLPLELKTGHNQNPSHHHLAQLTMYTIMLRTRHGSCNKSRGRGDSCNVERIGAADSGMLLYLNHEGYRATHVKPTLSDVKTLIGTRNSVVCDVIRASRPRGIAIKYKDDARVGRSSVVTEEPPPPSALPNLQPSISSCERCYNNRECMMYASADSMLSRHNGNSAAALSPPPHGNKNSGHGKLLNHFTGHLTRADLEYFRKWDRLIDIERHASARDAVSKSWLFESGEKEARDGKCMSSLLLDEVVLFSTEFDDDIICGVGEEDVSIRLIRSNDSAHTTPLSSLSFDVGNNVIVSEDGTSFVKVKNDYTGHFQQREIRHKMHILRGTVTRIGEHDIDISVPNNDVGRLKRFVKSGDGISSRRMFRLDKDEHGGSFGLLFQNLVNFFTLDIPSFSAESLGTPAKTKTLTVNTIYSSRRRRLNSSVVGLEPPPRFRNVLPDSLFTGDAFALDVPGCDLFSLKRDFDGLNSDQVSRLVVDTGGGAIFHF